MAEQRSEDHEGTTGEAGGRRLASLDAVFCVLALVALLPALLVRYPASVDYLNHLARLSVLTAGADDPIHAFYRIHWHLIPNLGIELIAMPLAAFLPLEAVMKIILVVCVLGMAAALWFLHRALYQRTQASLLLGALALINLPLTVGLLSFTLGLALAVAATGLWLRLGERPSVKSILTLNVLAALILVVHIAACAALALTLGGLAILRPPYGVAEIAKRAAAIASSFVVPALLLVLIALSGAASADATGVGAIGYVPALKFRLITAPVFTGIVIADVLGAVLLWTMLLIALRRGAQCERRLVAPLLLWLATLIALPSSIGSATIVDLRLAVFPMLLLIGGISVAPLQRIWQRALVGVAILGVVVRTALLIPSWQGYDADVASFRGIDHAVERRAKVIVAAAPSAPGLCREQHGWDMFDEHIPVLLVIDRGAFVSTLFAAPGQQPIEPMPAVSDIAVPDIGIAPWSILASGAGSAAAPAKVSPLVEKALRLYGRDWRKNYDYLALRRLDCPAEIPPEPDLVPVAESATYRLYRIVHGAP